MRGHAFSKFIPNELPKGSFEELLKLFLELLNYTSGDANEALDWMNELDKQYKLTSDDYGMGDFIEDLKKKGYLGDDDQNPKGFKITSKTEQSIRQSALEEIFGKLKKSGKGGHNTNISGNVPFNDVYLLEFDSYSSL